MYRKHLDPSLTQVEKCLLRRAEAAQEKAAGLVGEGVGERVAALTEIAAEFRALAGELHEL